MKLKILPYLFLLFLTNNIYSQTLIDAIYDVDTARIRELVESGTDINQVDENGFYPLYWVSELLEYDYEGQYQPVYDLMIELGAIDYNDVYSDFFAFCSEGNLDSVKKYVENGFDLKSKFIWYDPSEEDPGCDCYKTALSYAVESGNLELVKYLVENGAEISFDIDGMQPLGLALTYRYYEIADFLIEKGADKNVYFVLDEPFYSYAIDFYGQTIDTVLLDYLLKNNFEYSSSDYASAVGYIASTGDVETMKKLLPILSNLYVNEAFCYAATIEMAELLIENGAEVNSQYFIYGEGGYVKYESAIMNAVIIEDMDYIKYLLEKGADLNSLDNFGDSYSLGSTLQTPLMMAVNLENYEITEILLKHGASVNIMFHEIWSDYYYSPLIFAVEKNNYEIVDLLIKYGASVVNYEISALDYTTNETDKKIIKLLKKHK